MAEKTPPMRIRVWQNEPNGEFVASFPGDLYLDENTEYVRADSHDKLVEALRDVVTFAHFYHGKMEDTIGDEALDALGDTARAALASLQPQEEGR